MLHALAFITWDIGSRSTQRLVGDVRRGFGSARSVAKGISRLIIGGLLLIAGALLILSVTVADIRTEFSTLETGAILAGLLVEMLVGDPIRAHISNR